MNQKPTTVPSSTKAFSLIELIAAIVLSSVLIALLLPLLGTGLTGNIRLPALQVQGTYALRSHMDYWVHQSSNDFAGDLPGLSVAIDEGKTDSNDEVLYLVLFNDWVTFDEDGHLVEGDEDDLLRVTLGNEQGDNLTFIFSPEP